MRSIGAIVFAAGASTRFGRPKQLVMIGTENLLQRSIRAARGVPCSPSEVVLGASADLVIQECNLDGVQVVMNLGWPEGMAASIRAGIDALPEVDGVIVMACDMPAVTPEHLRALAESGQLMDTSYDGHRGIPAYLPRSTFSALRNLRRDKRERAAFAATGANQSGDDRDERRMRTITTTSSAHGQTLIRTKPAMPVLLFLLDVVDGQESVQRHGSIDQRQDFSLKHNRET